MAPMSFHNVDFQTAGISLSVLTHCLSASIIGTKMTTDKLKR